MLSSIPLNKLRDRVKVYLGKVPAREIKDNEPTAVVLAPVEAGISRFIDVNNLPSLDDLPFIPERMRDFSFRYATEYKPNKVWAKEYGVEVNTIRKWLRHEGVRSYIAVCRFEQRMFNLAQHVIMQRNVCKTINAILTTKITADTIAPIAQTARFFYQILTDPQNAPTRAKGTLNVNIGYPPNPADSVNSSPGSGNPYTQERNVTPKRLAALQADIDELEIIAKGLSDDGDSADE
jgi:hypothetical protein